MPRLRQKRMRAVREEREGNEQREEIKESEQREWRGESEERYWRGEGGRRCCCSFNACGGVLFKE